MPRPQKTPLRPLTAHERATLAQVARSGAERADRVGRAKALLAVADGATFTAAARAAGRRSGDGVAKLVARVNAEGLAALTNRPGGRPPLQYGPEEAARILHEARRPPDRDADGTATWSLTTLQRALRTAPDGLPHVSTATSGGCCTRPASAGSRTAPGARPGVVQRKRKAGVGHGGRSGYGGKKGVIERAYRTAEALGIPGLVPGRGRPLPGDPAGGRPPGSR